MNMHGNFIVFFSPFFANFDNIEIFFAKEKKLMKMQILCTRVSGLSVTTIDDEKLIAENRIS